jgi:hypothetical protein
MPPDPSTAHGDDSDKPTLRQKLHAATGDRDAEAEALADRTEEDLGEDEAEIAVRRAHGDIPSPVPTPEDELARPQDAEAVRDERSQ